MNMIDNLYYNFRYEQVGCLIEKKTKLPEQWDDDVEHKIKLSKYSLNADRFLAESKVPSINRSLTHSLTHFIDYTYWTNTQYNRKQTIICGFSFVIFII